MRRCASQPLVRRAAPTPSSSPRTKSVRASSGTGASDGELLGLADPVPVGVPLGVAVELVGTAPSGGDTAGVDVVEPAMGPAEPEEPVAADAPVSAAASAARTAASSSCTAIAFAAASICCCGVRAAADGVGVGLGAVADDVGVEMLDGAVDDGAVTEEKGRASEARGAGVPSAGAVVRVPGVVAGVAVSDVLGVPAATDGAVVDATGLGVVGVVGVVDRVTGGAARSLGRADGVGVGRGVLVAVVGTDVGVGLGVLGIVLARSLVAVLAVALGTVLGVGLGVVRIKLRSSSPGVLLVVLVLVLGDVLLVGVASAGVVAPLGDGVGTDDAVARAAAADRNALTTSAVICSRARWSCAFSSGETKGLLDAAPAPGFGVGVIVTVYPSGTGVGVRAPAPGVGESVPSAPWSPLASELVGVGLGVSVPAVGSTGTAAPPAPSWPMPGMPIVKAPAAGGVGQMGGFPASEACVPMAAAAAGVATAAGPNASSRTARDRLLWGLSGSCFMATPVGIVHKGIQVVRHDTQVHSGRGCGDQEARLYGYDRPRRRVAR